MSYGSNYPPGVTGSEYEIAGPSWEGEVNRECGRQADLSPVTTTLRDAIIDVVREKVPIEKGRRALQSALDEAMDYSDQRECPFDGEVYAWAYGGVLHWTCPVCGYEHEEDGRDDE